MRSRFNRSLNALHYLFSWSIRSWLRDKSSPAFMAHHNTAMTEVLTACNDLSLNYCAIEGTLIALLRYGHLGQPGPSPCIDDDIDLMVVHETHEAWQTSALALRNTLLRQGWEDAFRAGPLLSTSERSDARHDKLKLRKFSRTSRRIWTHLDLHSCLAPATKTYLVSHDTAEEYPFQKWAGRIPREWLFPSRKARFNHETCPVPQRPIELLARWNNGEYDEKSLLYPLRKISAKERRHIDASVAELDRQGYASFAPLLPARASNP